EFLQRGKFPVKALESSFAAVDRSYRLNGSAFIRCSSRGKQVRYRDRGNDSHRHDHHQRNNVRNQSGCCQSFSTVFGRISFCPIQGNNRHDYADNSAKAEKTKGEKAKDAHHQRANGEALLQVSRTVKWRTWAVPVTLALGTLVSGIG